MAKDYYFEIYDEVDENLWNEKLKENRTSTAFQTSNWIYAHVRIDSKPIFIYVKNNKGEIVSQLAAIYHKNFLRNDNIMAQIIGSKILKSSVINWSYGPIIHVDQDQDKILLSVLQALDKIAKENNIMMIRGSSPPLSKQFSDDVFGKAGYVNQPWSTYVLHLTQNENDWYDSLDKKTRYDIKKSQNDLYEFEEKKGPSFMKEFLELKNEEYEMQHRRKSPIPDSNELHYKYLNHYGYEKVFLVNADSKPVSGIMLGIFNGNVIQSAVVTSRKTPLAGSFLTWKTIQWSINNKQITYDMGGANPFPKSEKEKNIDFYKSKWGGCKHDYSIYTKIFDNRKMMISSILKNPKGILKRSNTTLIHFEQ